MLVIGLGFRRNSEPEPNPKSGWVRLLQPDTQPNPISCTQNPKQIQVVPPKIAVR
jgi:hypothetical protein